MKNFRQYLMTGIAMLMLTACPSDPVQEPEQKTGQESGQNSSTNPASQTFTQNIVLPPKASEQVVTLNQLNSSVATVGNSSSWLNVETQAYTSGFPRIKLRSTDNTERVERKCSVTITASSGDKVILSITQQGVSEGTEIDDLHGSQTDKPAYRRR